MQDYVSKFAVLLANANDDPESEAGQEVQVSHQAETDKRFLYVALLCTLWLACHAI